MNYTLNAEGRRPSAWEAARKLWPLVAPEKGILALAFAALALNSLLNLVAPYLIGRAIDESVATGDYAGVLRFAGVLLVMYLLALVVSYGQTKLMGGVGQRVLYRLRNLVFAKVQDLPVAFFNQNKAGDLISRINNDTDKLNQFFSQSLMRFVGSLFIMAGAAGFLIALSPRLGLAALAPAIVLLAFTRLISPWVRRKNATSLTSVGNMSGEIQESLENFKAVVAFDRRDYFRDRFNAANADNYRSAVGAGVANNLFAPVYDLSSNAAQVFVLAYGIVLIASGQLTVGLLIAFLAYIQSFYGPLRQLAALWSSFEVAMAGWERVSEMLALESNLARVDGAAATGEAVLRFDNVTFSYPEGKEVLRGASFDLEAGKTYALVGPTGGGKTTTASLMARLYDPTGGTVFLRGKDIRSYDEAERAKRIGFILQEPFLFSGTVGENVAYGNSELEGRSAAEIAEAVRAAGLDTLLARFDQGLETPVVPSGDSVSLGQKQLVAFIRAALRKPDLLILDEATANIDTVTESLLGAVLDTLPAATTRVVIAHRLNTIENADEIFFVNGGDIVRAGSLQHAVDLLMKGYRNS